MNRRKKIYKGFNKRRKNYAKEISMVGGLIILGATILFTNIDDVEVDKKEDNKTEFSYEDIKDVVDKEESEEVEEKVEETMVASIDEWTFYTVQVASMNEDTEVEKLTTELNKKKIPYSVLDVDGVKKIQTHTSFNKESIRDDLEFVRNDYPDSFLAEVKMPMISLEYTKKYEYISEITNNLNTLVKNFEEECGFWAIDEINLENYNQILVNRRSILDKIKLEIEKIDYEDMNIFKENLTTYINQIEENIEVASKSANEQNENISKGILLDSMQGYLEFINSLG